MRMLGVKASLSGFRWDLVYLIARLMADERAEVKALVPLAQALRADLAAQRDALEAAEDAVIITSALVDRGDARRDEVLVQLGGVARATDKVAYGVLFPKTNPSHTARLSIDAESVEIARILGELGAMPAEHPLRAAYLTELTEAEVALKAADQQSDAAVLALSLQRSQIDRLKAGIDKGRLEIHGKLISLIKSKAEVESFFRPTTTSPGEEEKPKDPAPVKPA